MRISPKTDGRREPRWTGAIRFVAEKLDEPMRWRKRERVFVNSMSDLFHEQVPGVYIEEVFRVMVEADWHVYQLLTKRADRLRQISRALPRKLVVHDHIWLGVSVEDRKYGVPRIQALRQARAGKRFLSIEPLLEARPLVALRIDRVGRVLGDVEVHADAELVGQLAQGVQRVVVERHHRVRADERTMLRLAHPHLLQKRRFSLSAASRRPRPSRSLVS